MGWTESGGRRSRDEILADVVRRGSRLRLRRRAAMAAAGAVALVLPVGAFVSLAPDGDRAMNVTAAGTSHSSPGAVEPTFEVTTTTLTVEGTEPAAAPTTVGPSGSAPPSTVRSSGPAPAVTTTRPPTDPVVRPSPTTVPDNGSIGGPALTTVTTAPPTGAPLEVCPVASVRVTVTTGKPTYVRGETVTGSSTLENRAGYACMVSARAFFRIVDQAGKDVSGFAYTADFRMPVRAEPGQTFSSGSFTWTQKDCSTSAACPPVPAGTYTAVADWSEAAPYSGRTTLTVSP